MKSVFFHSSMMENITMGVHGHALMAATIGAPHEWMKIITTSWVIGENALLNAIFQPKIQEVSSIDIVSVISYFQYK